MTLVSIFLYYLPCQKSNVSQHELYSQEEFRAGIAWSVAVFIEREMKQEQLHYLSKLIDLRYKRKKKERNFVYYLTLYLEE